mmetsp:Transcript_11905/g.29872  ORF Transcript_11905/g.29872 Transcript_11905/m.29872 type:complete len:250 (+) Transcript_11905:1427-2176(+)
MLQHVAERNIVVPDCTTGGVAQVFPVTLMHNRLQLFKFHDIMKRREAEHCLHPFRPSIRPASTPLHQLVKLLPIHLVQERFSLLVRGIGDVSEHLRCPLAIDPERETLATIHTKPQQPIHRKKSTNGTLVLVLCRPAGSGDLLCVPSAKSVHGQHARGLLNTNEKQSQLGESSNTIVEKLLDLVVRVAYAPRHLRHHRHAALAILHRGDEQRIWCVVGIRVQGDVLAGRRDYPPQLGDQRSGEGNCARA